MTTISKDDKVAIVLGAETSVGRELIQQLCSSDSYISVKVLHHQKINIPTHKKVHRTLISFRDIEALNKMMVGDDLFICFDKTFFDMNHINHIHAAAFKHFPMLFYQAYKQGVKQCLFLSDKNANPESLKTSNRLKGLLELAVFNTKFWAIYVLKPSLVIETIPNQSEWGKELADKISNRINRYSFGWWTSNRPIEAHIVARAMVEKAQEVKGGKFILKSSWLQDYYTHLNQSGG